MKGHALAWLIEKRVEVVLWHAELPRWKFALSFVLAHLLAALSWGWVFDPIPLIDEAFTLFGLVTVWQAALGRAGIVKLPEPKKKLEEAQVKGLEEQDPSS